MKISNINIYDLEDSVKASKYPMAVDTSVPTEEITDRTKNLALSNKGEGHDQFLTGIRVHFTISCSKKMWVELERYRFVDYVDRISAIDSIIYYGAKVAPHAMEIDPNVIDKLDELRTNFIKNRTLQDYLILRASIPAGYEDTVRVGTNYRSLKTMYHQRNTHRLPEWHSFCKFIEALPYADKLIVGEDRKNPKIASAKTVHDQTFISGIGMDHDLDKIVGESDLEVSNIHVCDLKQALYFKERARDSRVLNFCMENGIPKRFSSGVPVDQFLSDIRVSFDLKCTNDMWVDLEQCRTMDFVSSQSTMHRIARFDLRETMARNVELGIVDILEEKKELYNAENTPENYRGLLMNNPSGFMLTARLTTNYLTLRNLYNSYKISPIPEWKDFCSFIEQLPHSKELILNDNLACVVYNSHKDTIEHYDVFADYIENETNRLKRVVKEDKTNEKLSDEEEKLEQFKSEIGF